MIQLRTKSSQYRALDLGLPTKTSIIPRKRTPRQKRDVGPKGQEIWKLIRPPRCASILSHFCNESGGVISHPVKKCQRKPGNTKKTGKPRKTWEIPGTKSPTPKMSPKLVLLTTRTSLIQLVRVQVKLFASQQPKPEKTRGGPGNPGLQVNFGSLWKCWF